eukprot:403341708
MNVVGCGNQCTSGLYQTTSQPIVFPLTLTYGYIALAGSQSLQVLDIPNQSSVHSVGMFFVRYDDYMNIEWSRATNTLESSANEFVTSNRIFLSDTQLYVTIVDNYRREFYLFNTEKGIIESQWIVPTTDRIGTINARYLNQTYIFSSSSNNMIYQQLGIADLTLGICRQIGIKTSILTLVVSLSQIIDENFVYFLGYTYTTKFYLIKVNQTDSSQNKWTQLTKSGVAYMNTFHSFQSQTQPSMTYHSFQSYFYQSAYNVGYVGIIQENNSDLLNSNFQVKNQWTLTFPVNSNIFSAGIFSNDYQVSLAFFSQQSSATDLEYASITTINITDTGNFQASSEIFYSAQNGFLIQFVSFNFNGIGRGVLGGTIVGGQYGQFYYIWKQGVAIDLPEPYYFSMGAPYLVDVQTLPLSGLQIASFTTGMQYSYITTYTDLSINNTFYDFSTNNITVPSPIYLTYRTLTIPPFNLSYEYFLGDIALKIDFPECIYNQSCSDAVITYKVLFDNMTSIPQDTLKFIPSSRSLYIQSKNQSVVGDYNLLYKCNLQDGFSQTQTFSVKITWDGRDLDPPPVIIDDHSNDSGNSNNSDSGIVVNQNNYQPNYAPLFYEKPRDIVIISGRSALLTLPEYYDPNPNDKVTIKFETIERYKTFFRLVNQNTIQFDAGFTELGDKQLIITLRDNNKNPKESKYLITATFLQSDIEDMENTYVSKVNLTNSTQYIKAFENQKQITINQVTPDGKLELSFEKSLNITNKTQAIEQVKKALLLSFQDSDIQFDWDIIDIYENKIIIQIKFRNPLLISSQQVSYYSSLQVHDIGKNNDEYSIGESWLVHRNQNKLICGFRIKNASINTFE